MIHVNVRRKHQQHGGDPYAFIVETSTDGAGWKTQYMLALSHGDTLARVKADAEQTARVFAAGCEYAGAETRKTSGGYTL